MGDFVEEQKTINAQLSQKIDTMENIVDKRIDGLQSEMEHKLDNLQYSTSRLTNQQLAHQVEVNPEEVYLSDTMVGEHSEQQLQEEMIEDFAEVVEGLSESSNSGVVFLPWKKEEEIIALLTEEGSGKEVEKEPQKLTLQPIPMKLNPSATAQATNSPLPSPDPVHTLLSPPAQFTPETPTPKAKATPSALPVLHNIIKLVATVRAFATTSKTLAAADVAWHSGWFGCWFEFGAPEPRHF